jgi:hypothetical protein
MAAARPRYLQRWKQVISDILRLSAGASSCTIHLASAAGSYGSAMGEVIYANEGDFGEQVKANRARLSNVFRVIPAYIGVP